MSINIILAGPRGKMGSEAIKMIEKEADFKLVACIDHKNNGKELKDIVNTSLSVPIFDDAEICF